MADGGTAKATMTRARAQTRAAPSDRMRDAETGPRSTTPARSVPAELAVLLGELERLQGELAASRARVKELEATADTDPLTQVFNRRGFERELNRSLAYIKRYWTRAALFYVDLDGFKPVNDSHGHAAGDAVLKAVAATLAASVRASDTVARLGGDEFALILWNLGEADAASKSWSLEAAIGETVVTFEGATLSVGASIGFTMLDPEDELARALLKADQAMYRRKAARKGYRAAATSR